MPSSRPNTVPTVIHLLRQLRPQSILDIGIGFGKWGHLFREYTDIQEAEHDPARYQKQNWRVRIDGLEGYPAYVTEMHRYLYNDIHLGDASVVLPGLPLYDLIFLGDVIEHFDKPSGERLLREAVAHARKAVLVTTPKFDTGQSELCDNQLEQHRSLWSGKDFRQFEGAVVKTIDGDTLLATIAKPGLAALDYTPPRTPKPAVARRMRQALEELGRAVPPHTPFVLIDEEQIRQQLPHRQAIPFLEKSGEYWGPPADDATAIAECERLRQGGAAFLAIIWPCFWWLEHYAGFRQHLQGHFRCVVQTDSLLVYDLRSVP